MPVNPFSRAQVWRVLQQSLDEVKAERDRRHIRLDRLTETKKDIEAYTTVRLSRTYLEKVIISQADADTISFVTDDASFSLPRFIKRSKLKCYSFFTSVDIGERQDQDDGIALVGRFLDIAPSTRMTLRELRQFHPELGEVMVSSRPTQS